MKDLPLNEFHHSRQNIHSSVNTGVVPSLYVLDQRISVLIALLISTAFLKFLETIDASRSVHIAGTVGYSLAARITG